MTDDDINLEEGGESACFAHLICPECGTVLDGSNHAKGCPSTYASRIPEAIEQLQIDLEN